MIQQPFNRQHAKLLVRRFASKIKGLLPYQQIIADAIEALPKEPEHEIVPLRLRDAPGRHTKLFKYRQRRKIRNHMVRQSRREQRKG